MEETFVELQANNTPENVTLDMLYQEVQDLKSNLGQLFNIFATEEANAAGEHRGIPRFEQLSGVELATDVEETSMMGN